MNRTIKRSLLVTALGVASLGIVSCKDKSQPYTIAQKRHEDARLYPVADPLMPSKEGRIMQDSEDYVLELATSRMVSGGRIGVPSTDRLTVYVSKETFDKVTEGSLFNPWTDQCSFEDHDSEYRLPN